MWIRTLFVMAALVACTAFPTSAQTLGVGDKAPKLEVREFVKGKPVTGFEKGKNYVVEFWATWCGPCRTSIPHLTELQKKYPNVTFVGVSVWENDQKAVKPFVTEMGGKMAYTVAMDVVPDGAKGNDGVMAKTWMTAAGQDGIPAAFIVNGEGRIAWIGHPMGMEKPLDKVVAGKWDIDTAIAENKKELAQKRKMTELRGKLAKAQQSGDPKQILAVVDGAIADEPSMEETLGFMKYRLLATPSGNQDKALEYGKRLVEVIWKDNAAGLNQFSWSIIDPEAPVKAGPQFVKLALLAAQRADKVAEGKDPAIADTLALAYFNSGNAAKALEVQERAVKLAKGTQFETDPDIQKRLEQYRKAVKK